MRREIMEECGSKIEIKRERGKNGGYRGGGGQIIQTQAKCDTTEMWVR